MNVFASRIALLAVQSLGVRFLLSGGEVLAVFRAYDMLMEPVQVQLCFCKEWLVSGRLATALLVLSCFHILKPLKPRPCSRIHTSTSLPLPPCACGKTVVTVHR